MVRPRTFFMASALLISMLVFSGCARRPAETEGLEIGSPAPAFKLPDMSGQEVSLSQFKGKIVLLDFWATWCGPCRMTMPVLEKLGKEYANQLILLAVNVQEPKDVVREYIREQGLDSRVLLDEEGSVVSAYGASAIPMHVLIDKTGIVRNIQVGFNPKMASQLRAEIAGLR